MAVSIVVPQLALAAALAGGASAQAVAVTQPIIRLGDLADIATVPATLRARAARIEIVRLADTGEPRVLPRSFVVWRVRCQFPLLASWAEGHLAEDYTVSYRPPAAARTDERCLRAVRDIAGGSVLHSDDFAPSACGNADRKEPSSRFVPTERAVRARQAIAAGSVVSRFAGYGDTVAHAGDTMTLLASSGPVIVTRRVRVLQSARRNERLFVETADGEVISAPRAKAKP